MLKLYILFNQFVNCYESEGFFYYLFFNFDRDLMAHFFRNLLALLLVAVAAAVLLVRRLALLLVLPVHLRHVNLSTLFPEN